ncbi:potassium/proton antiporter [Pontibacter lucknowensis]|uniref:Potassium/proton antiporter, CPA1 family n=1 Tax=Pontibacter lucknowensis TaxID=1077936 RepID=A0A1N6UF13_9BACT|nr:potassium/proton antiporter [Pontibacter lucknowensis]SIQ64248.1 potassium/proton antiporter, CPA1 family [Pontibacter lucknowensis]
MAVTFEDILLVSSILLFISILISKSLGRFGVPALILFLGVGMLAGSEGLGKIYFNDAQTAQSLGTVALAFILFSGGLDTRWESTKPILWRGVILATVGVFITAISLGAFVYFVTDFTLLESLLLGSIVSSTDAAAVFSILRSKNIGLKNNLRPTLELESGSNDPMAYFLTVSFTFLIMNQEASIWQLVPMFFMQMSIGAVAGIAMGRAMVWVINRIKLEQEGLYPALTMAMVIFTYAFTNVINGNGFLAVYVAAVILGNRNFIHKRSLTKFYDGIAWLMQILMFLTLGLLVFPSHMLPVVGTGLLISMFLIFVARPVSVFLSMAFFKNTIQDKLYVSWVGLRGAVPIVFATYPMLAGVEKSDMIFNIVFFIVLTSVMLQGTTLSPVAKWLNLSEKDKKLKKHQFDLEMEYDLKNELTEIEVPDSSPAVGKTLVDLHFPKGALIVLINRNRKFVTPNGATMLEPKDKLFVMTDNDEELTKVNELLGYEVE